jgi:hypothetical protein
VLTPALLAPYISEEVWNVLDRLAQDAPGLGLEALSAAAILPIPSLIPLGERREVIVPLMG